MGTPGEFLGKRNRMTLRYDRWSLLHTTWLRALNRTLMASNLKIFVGDTVQHLLHNYRPIHHRHMSLRAPSWSSPFPRTDRLSIHIFVQLPPLSTLSPRCSACRRKAAHTSGLICTQRTHGPCECVQEVGRAGRVAGNETYQNGEHPRERQCQSSRTQSHLGP